MSIYFFRWRKKNQFNKHLFNNKLAKFFRNLFSYIDGCRKAEKRQKKTAHKHTPGITIRASRRTQTTGEREKKNRQKRQREKLLSLHVFVCVFGGNAAHMQASERYVPIRGCVCVSVK